MIFGNAQRLLACLQYTDATRMQRIVMYLLLSELGPLKYFLHHLIYILGDEVRYVGTQLQVEAVTTRGLLEADARGGVERRKAKLQACLAEPSNQQSGALSLKIGIDASGSVSYSKATGGDLVGTPLATCLLPVFYKMGFAAPASNGAYFEITLRTP